MPKTLILLSPFTRTVVPIRQPEEWTGQTCFHCQRRIENDRTVFLVNRRDDESPVLTCSRCVRATRSDDLCLWCGGPGEPRDTGDAFCRPCWTVYVAYVDGDTEETALLQQVNTIIKEKQGAAEVEAPAPADEAQGEDRPLR